MSTDTPENQQTPKTHAPSPNTRCPLSIRLPPQFKALCDRDGTTMREVLQSFAADLCDIAPLTRQTKYTSRGAAAHAAARAYYEATGYGKQK
jgi:hypothetical protein